MSDRLPSLKGLEVVRVLTRAGFAVTLVKGSNHIMRHRHDATRGTVVPVHAGQDIKRGLLRKIISDTGLTVGEFVALL